MKSKITVFGLSFLVVSRWLARICGSSTTTAASTDRKITDNNL